MISEVSLQSVLSYLSASGLALALFVVFGRVVLLVLEEYDKPMKEMVRCTKLPRRLWTGDRYRSAHGPPLKETAHCVKLPGSTPQAGAWMKDPMMIQSAEGMSNGSV